MKEEARGNFIIVLNISLKMRGNYDAETFLINSQTVVLWDKVCLSFPTRQA